MKYILLLLTILFAVGAGCELPGKAEVYPEDTVQNEPTEEAGTTSTGALVPGEVGDVDDMVVETVEQDDIEEDTVSTDAEQVAEPEVPVVEEPVEEPVVEGPGEYGSYDAAAVTEAATNGEAVLFFHAPWCPTCKVLNSDIEASLDDIPSNVTIFKTDYDSQTELKRQYGVTYQHTLVHVDADGNIISKWSGGSTLESILDRL